MFDSTYKVKCVTLEKGCIRIMITHYASDPGDIGVYHVFPVMSDDGIIYDKADLDLMTLEETNDFCEEAIAAGFIVTKNQIF